MDASDPRHGTYAGAPAHRTAGQAVCFPCRVAHANYLTHVARQRAYGQWHPWTDAEPARQHVRALMAEGTGIRRIAKAAGVRPSRLTHLLYGVSGRPAPTKIRPDYSAAILALEPDPATVPIWRVSRRLAALIAIGYSQPALAKELGYTQQRIADFLTEKQAAVRVDTFNKVAALYDRLCMTLPPTDTRGEKYSASRARNTAARNGYLPPLAWTDIDDPDEHPTDWAYVPADRTEAVQAMADRGDNLTHACRALNISINTFYKWCVNNHLVPLYRVLASREGDWNSRGRSGNNNNRYQDPAA